MMRSRLSHIQGASLRLIRPIAVVLAAICVACSDSAKSPLPTTPTSPVTPAVPPPPTNRAPIVDTINVSAFGVSGLTPIVMSAAASDPDGDTVSYSWSFPGGQAPTSSTTATLAGDGAVTVTLQVTDAKGLATTISRTVVIGTMTGRWNYVPTSGAACGPFGILTPPVMTMTQTGKSVVGTIASPAGWCNVPGGTSGAIDPAGPGTIDADGNFTARVKMNPFVDDFWTAKMDTTGRELTGRATFQNLPGFNTFWLRKL